MKTVILTVIVIFGASQIGHVMAGSVSGMIESHKAKIESVTK